MTAVAFEQTALAHRPALLALSRRHGLPREDAEDAVQRALVGLWRRRLRIDPDRAVGLMRVAVTWEVRHYWRDRPRNPAPRADSSPDRDEPSALLARRRAVWQALETLGLADRELVWRAWVRQEPLRDLARVRKTHRVTLWRHLGGLRDRLAEALAPWDPTRDRRHPVGGSKAPDLNPVTCRPWGRADRLVLYSGWAAP